MGIDNSQLSTRRLFEKLRTFRNSIFDHSCYYDNETLRLFAEFKPTSKEALLKIRPNETQFERFGEAFLQLIRNEQLESDRLLEIERKTLLALRNYEIELYKIVQSVLEHCYRDKWWYEGIPELIRKKASQLHEETRGLVAREYCLMFIDLKDIIIKEWSKFKFIEKIIKKDKKFFTDSLEKLNDIRNRLCHPLRLMLQPITEEDSDCVADSLKLLNDISKEIDFVTEADKEHRGTQSA